MKSNLSYIIILLCSLILCTSCESEAERNKRLAKQEQARIEREKQDEAERIATEARLEKEHREKAIYDKYINNTLRTGDTPYAYCFGANMSCSEWGCAGISVKTPYNSDVVVTIKKGDKVVRHAYIAAGKTYQFEFPNGTYQTFFYYGKGWNPDKVMKEIDCGTLKGGFIADELFSKDAPQILNNSILSYELILQQSGNFSTKPSNLDEAF